MTIVCQRRDINFYIGMQAYGSIAIVAFVIIIIGQGIHSMTNTNYVALSYPTKEFSQYYEDKDLDTNVRAFFLINTNFAPLAGILGISYYLPQMSVPIVRANINQKNNERDLRIAYIVTCLIFIITGTFGYFGFLGVQFTEYAKQSWGMDKPISQVCITMYNSTAKLAFLMRVVWFLMIFFNFPLVTHFLRSGVLKLIFGIDIV